LSDVLRTPWHFLNVSSEHLKTVPDLLETLMSEKRLLQAAILLMGSLKIINKPDMLEIGAVSDLRGYLNSQEFVRITISDIYVFADSKATRH